MEIKELDYTTSYWPDCTPSRGVHGEDAAFVQRFRAAATIRVPIGVHWVYGWCGCWPPTEFEDGTWLVAVSDHGSDHTNRRHVLLKAGECNWSNLSKKLEEIHQIIKNW